MVKILLRVLITAAALLALAHFVPGIAVSGWYAAIITAIIWGIIGLTVRPVLGLLTLPITLLTFGLFSFVLNALLFWFLSTFIAGFSVAGFIPALEGSAVLTVVSWALHAAL